MTEKAPGWFADRGDNPPDPRWPWQPHFQDALGCLPLTVWFETEELCEEFIWTRLVHAGHFEREH